MDEASDTAQTCRGGSLQERGRRRGRTVAQPDLATRRSSDGEAGVSSRTPGIHDKHRSLSKGDGRGKKEQGSRERRMLCRLSSSLDRSLCPPPLLDGGLLSTVVLTLETVPSNLLFRDGSEPGPSSRLEGTRAGFWKNSAQGQQTTEDSS